MRYRIEFLTETTKEESVCMSAFSEGPLEAAEQYALSLADRAETKHGAEGFQIRDLFEDGRIVALRPFDS